MFIPLIANEIVLDATEGEIERGHITLTEHREYNVKLRNGKEYKNLIFYFYGIHSEVLNFLTDDGESLVEIFAKDIEMITEKARG